MSRIDSSIRTTSYWRHLYAASYLVCIVISAAVLAMPWWAVGVIVCLSSVLYGLRLSLSHQPQHFTSADDTQKTSRWQLIYRDRETPVLWEAELIDVQSFAHFIQFKFQTVHPLVRQKNVLIWQDQVDSTCWRQLKVLSRWK